jgi:hypothetical protein
VALARWGRRLGDNRHSRLNRPHTSPEGRRCRQRGRHTCMNGEAPS